MPDEAALAGARALVEKKLDQPWDLLVHAWFDLLLEAPPAAVHREYFGKDGAFRAGPLDDGFDALFARMAVELDGAELVRIAEEIDAYCFDNALAVFLCAPQALYAVNNHVSFGPYKTTFEIAEVTVDESALVHAGRMRRNARGRAPRSRGEQGETRVRRRGGQRLLTLADGRAGCLRPARITRSARRRPTRRSGAVRPARRPGWR